MSRGVRRRGADWWFRNPRTGELVRGETPNGPLIVFLGGMTASVAVPDDDVSSIARNVAFFGLAWWALDEFVRGSTPFRRVMGAGTLLGMAVLAFAPSRRRDSRSDTPPGIL